MSNDPLFWNKIAGAILSAGLVAMASGFVAELLYRPELPDRPAYAIGGAKAAASPAAETPAAAAAPESIAPLLASASAEKGKKLARKCSACHSFDKGGPNKVGPNLWDVVGRDMAGVAGFGYSGALKEKGGTWDYEALNEFLRKPKAFVPGTRMAFAGLKNAKDRADLIVYLRSLSDDPKPLP